MFQLIFRDEYGQNAIISAGEDIDKLAIKAKSLVQQENMENALTRAEQQTDWTVYWVDFYDDEDNLLDVYYAGTKGVSSRRILAKQEEEINEYDIEEVEVKIRIYIGEMAASRGEKPKPIYAKDLKRFKADVSGYSSIEDKEVSNLDDPIFQGKGVYYIKKT